LIFALVVSSCLPSFIGVFRLMGRPAVAWIWLYHHSSISKWKLHPDRNYRSIEMLLSNHLSNRWCVIRSRVMMHFLRARMSKCWSPSRTSSNCNNPLRWNQC
jgi:hypothetical protein